MILPKTPGIDVRSLISRLIVRLASRIAPPSARERFIWEWNAELFHEAGRLGGLEQIRQATGAFADAATQRRLARRSPAERTGRAIWIGAIADDARRAIRGMRRSPGFAVVTVVTLALGLGGGAAIYTLLDAVVLEPLPYPHAARLVLIRNQVPGVGPDEVWGTSTAQQVYYANHASTLDGVASIRAIGANMQTPAGAQRVFGWWATASTFPLLGARAHIGRLIQPQDDRPGAPAVVVLSHRLWQRQFGGDPDVMGQTIQLNDNPVQVIGVVEPGMAAPIAPPGYASDLWIPLRIDPEGGFGNNHVYNMIGRVAPGATIDRVESELERLERELPGRFPGAYDESFFERSRFRTHLTPLKQAVVGETAKNLWVLFGAVSIVLLIACANVANLFAVRTEARGHDLTVRTALGASRADLARYLVTEALLLAVAGAVLALVVIWLGGPALLALAPEAMPRADAVATDAGTVAVTIVAAIIIGLLLGAYSLSRQRDMDLALLSSGRTTGAGRQRQRIRSVLIVAQVALSLTLVVGAGLLVESLRRINGIDPGFDPSGVVTVRLYLSPPAYPSDVDIWNAYSRILAGVRAIPGVTAAGMSEELPVEGSFGCTVQGFEEPAVYEHLRRAGQSTCAGQERATPGYFEALGIPVLRGRALTAADNQDPRRGAVVVSETFARRFWPDQDPIGKGVGPSGRRVEPYYRVVGVVGDVPADALDGEPANAVYYPIVHNPETPGFWGWWRAEAIYLVIRTDLTDPLSVVPNVRRVIEAVDPSIPVVRIRTMDELIAASLARFAFVSALLGIAAMVALTLAAVGLYGVVAYVVSRSTREIGLRIAVGADAAQVQRMFLKRSLVLTVVGIVVGLGASSVTTRLLQGLLFGVEPTDPVTFAVAAGVLTVVALVASWIPARRATRVDPVEVLRT